MARHYPNLFHSPPTGTAAAVSAFAVAVMGEKPTSHVDTAGAVSAHRAGRKNHAALRSRVLRIVTTSLAFIRAVNPLILDVPASFGVCCGAQCNHKVYSTKTKIVRIVFLTHHLRLWCASRSCRSPPVLSVHPVHHARAYSDWSPLTVTCTRTRTLRFRRSVAAPSPRFRRRTSPCRSYRRRSRCVRSYSRV